MADFGQSSSLEWLRLCQKEGKSLAGPDGRNDLEVLPYELRRHRKRKDAWMLINGIITFYQLLYKLNMTTTTSRYANCKFQCKKMIHSSM